MQRKLAQIDLLRELGLSDMCISFGVDTDEIAKSLPLVEDIDLSRNLLSSLEVVADICYKLQNLKILRLNYCRFTSPFEIRSKDKYLSQVSTKSLFSNIILFVGANFNSSFYIAILERYHADFGIVSKFKRIAYRS